MGDCVYRLRHFALCGSGSMGFACTVTQASGLLTAWGNFHREDLSVGIGQIVLKWRRELDGDGVGMGGKGLALGI